MTKYVVYVEVTDESLAEGGPLAHAPALPGATARGKTVDEATANLRQAMTDYLHLLRNAGEDVPRASEGIEFQVEEVEDDTFISDFNHINPLELEKLIEWLSLSRQEMINILKDLPEDAWEWKPDEDGWDLQQVVCHIADAERYYIDRLQNWPNTPLARLTAVRGVALDKLRALTADERNRVTAFNQSKWTARKVIRRMLEHEREHLSQIKKLIADYEENVS